MQVCTSPLPASRPVNLTSDRAYNSPSVVHDIDFKALTSSLNNIVFSRRLYSSDRSNRVVRQLRWKAIIERLLLPTCLLTVLDPRYHEYIPGRESTAAYPILRNVSIYHGNDRSTSVSDPA